MSNELDNNAFLAGDFISEHAVRGALYRRPRTVPSDAADAGDRRPTELPIGADVAASPANQSPRLRRWSVTELIARAAARPPTRGVAH